jgi:hypothetical protein
MVDRKVVPFDEFYYQLKLMHLFQKHPVLKDFSFVTGKIYLRNHRELFVIDEVRVRDHIY